MSKEAVAKLENEYKENIWKGSKSMIAYACHKISDCYETEKGYLKHLEKCEKKDLIRVVKNKDGEVFIDLTGKANGRGAYLKKDEEVFAKAQKSKVLNRIFEIEVKDEVFEELRKII